MSAAKSSGQHQRCSTFRLEWWKSRRARFDYHVSIPTNSRFLRSEPSATLRPGKAGNHSTSSPSLHPNHTFLASTALAHSRQKNLMRCLCRIPPPPGGFSKPSWVKTNTGTSTRLDFAWKTGPWGAGRARVLLPVLWAPAGLNTEKQAAVTQSSTFLRKGLGVSRVNQFAFR